MWRGTILEGAVHAAEALDHVLLAIAGDLESLHHRLGPVVADAARSNLVAVAGDVVLKRLDGQRVLDLQRLKPALRHRKWIVREVDLLLFLVVFVHRKIDDPGEFEPIPFDQVQLVAEFGAGKAGKLPELVGIAGDEERGIAILQPQGIAYSRCPFRADVIGERTCALAALAPHDVTEPGLALALRPGIHAVAERT